MEGTIFNPQFIALLVAFVVCLIILALAFAVVRSIWNDQINLKYLLSESSIAHPGTAPEDPPKASLSRFQFLVFTFVIAGLYLVLSIETGTLIEVPNGALILLGISGVTYAAGKAMNDNTRSQTSSGDTDSNSKDSGKPGGASGDGSAKLSDDPNVRAQQLALNAKAAAADASAAATKATDAAAAAIAAANAIPQ